MDSDFKFHQHYGCGERENVNRMERENDGKLGSVGAEEEKGRGRRESPKRKVDYIRFT